MIIFFHILKISGMDSAQKENRYKKKNGKNGLYIHGHRRKRKPIVIRMMDAGPLGNKRCRKQRSASGRGLNPDQKEKMTGV